MFPFPVVVGGAANRQSTALDESSMALPTNSPRSCTEFNGSLSGVGIFLFAVPGWIWSTQRKFGHLLGWLPIDHRSCLAVSLRALAVN